MSQIFDRNLLKLNRKKIFKNYPKHNFLVHEIANRIIENIDNLNVNFENSLEIAAMDGYLSRNLNIKNKIVGDINNEIYEEDLDFSNESFDLVVSNLNMHFVNDVVKFLIDVKRILKKGGYFIASFFGEENLSQLAHCLYLAQNEIYDGVSPIMPPTIDVKTAAMLLQKAGFVEPISDFDKIDVQYSDINNLFLDIKFMGQGNILLNRSRRFFSRRFFDEICKKYLEHYCDSSKKITATFEVVTIIGKKL